MKRRDPWSVIAERVAHGIGGGVLLFFGCYMGAVFVANRTVDHPFVMFGIASLMVVGGVTTIRDAFTGQGESIIKTRQELALQEEIRRAKLEGKYIEPYRNEKEQIEQLKVSLGTKAPKKKKNWGW